MDEAVDWNGAFTDEFLDYCDKIAIMIMKNLGGFLLPLTFLVMFLIIGGAILLSSAGSKNPAGQKPGILGGQTMTIPLEGAQLKGNKQAKVVISEFSDFQCPVCGIYFNQVYPQIQKDYVDSGKVLYAFFQFPLTQSHPNAQLASEATLCASDQWKFWEMHDKLFESQKEWSEAGNEQALKLFVEMASSLGLKTADFEQCLNSNKHDTQIKKDLNLGQKLGARGTPTFFINGKSIVGIERDNPFEQFRQIIEEELKNK